MTPTQITCPNCDTEIELTDALTTGIRAELKESLLAEVASREAKINAKAKELEAREDSIDAAVATQLKAKLSAAEEKAKTKVRTEFEVQLSEAQEELEGQRKDLKELRKAEVELRRQKVELQEAKDNADLEIARTLDEEREKIRKAAEAKVADQHRLKDLEKDKVINDLRGDLDAAKRRAEQGSSETQGEVLELDFEEKLRAFFPHDELQPVAKGVRGADILQLVRTNVGGECGAILWETKNAKAWGGKWIGKLKDDARDARAPIAIIVSTVLPPEIERFGLVDGVWVADPISAIPLAVALREQLIALEHERQTSIGKNEKMELIYQYLAGPEFRQKIEGIIEAFTAMQVQIARERRAMEKQWKEREQQIDRVIKNTAGLYGDMQGIIGGQIPQIAALELDDDPSPPLIVEGNSVGDDEEVTR
jgi:hypothetical protein